MAAYLMGAALLQHFCHVHWLMRIAIMLGGVGLFSVYLLLPIGAESETEAVLQSHLTTYARREDRRPASNICWSI